MTPVLNEGRSSAASTPPPSTADYVQFHALHRPTAVALVANGHEIVYRQFNADLKKFTHALGAILPPAARSVAIECDELYLHWLLVLACENLGLVTASLQGELISASRPVLAFVDVVICEHDVPAEWAKAIHRVTQDWVNGVLAMPEPDGREEIPRAVRGLEEPTRIVRSSGTTGPGKLMLASRSIEEVNVRNFNLHMGFSKESRFLITSLFNVASMFWRATSLLRLGATCVFDARVSVAKAIMTYKPTHVRLFQYQVRGVLDELPTDYQKPERLTVMMGAGPLPDDMRQRILARLATELIYTYNSNETWIMGVVDVEGIATLRPGVEAEVIDEQGQPLADGQPGRIKIKSDSLVDGYANDPEATARVFKDGWFHSGDMGTLVGPRRLKVLGRLDDILNIGGIKILPTTLEDLVVGTRLVAEAGVTSIPGPDGIHEICIAVVPEASADLPTITHEITAKVWPPVLGRVRVMAMPKLPRTETGKLQRHRLTAAFQEQAGIEKRP